MHDCHFYRNGCIEVMALQCDFSISLCLYPSEANLARLPFALSRTSAWDHILVGSVVSPRWVLPRKLMKPCLSQISKPLPTQYCAAVRNLYNSCASKEDFSPPGDTCDTSDTRVEQKY